MKQSSCYTCVPIRLECGGVQQFSHRWHQLSFHDVKQWSGPFFDTHQLGIWLNFDVDIKLLLSMSKFWHRQDQCENVCSAPSTHGKESHKLTEGREKQSPRLLKSYWTEQLGTHQHLWKFHPATFWTLFFCKTFVIFFEKVFQKRRIFIELLRLFVEELYLDTPRYQLQADRFASCFSQKNRRLQMSTD